MLENERHDNMRVICAKALKEYEFFLERCSLSPELQDFLLGFASEKLKTKGIRSYFVWLVAQFVEAQMHLEGTIPKQNAQSSLFDSKLPLTAELVVIVQYIENHILDGKYGVSKNKKLNKARIDQCVLSGGYLQGKIADYISEVFLDSPLVGQLVQQKIRLACRLVSIGQYLEAQYGTYACFRKAGTLPKKVETTPEADTYVFEEHIDAIWEMMVRHGANPNKENFARCYLQRIALTSGAFFVVWSEIIMDLMGYDGPAREQLRRFSGAYGMLVQLMNDNADFIPTLFDVKSSGKQLEDAISDLRNNVVTLPLILFFSKKTEVTLNKLKRSKDLEIYLSIQPIIHEQAIPLCLDFMRYNNEIFSIDNPLKDRLNAVNNIAENPKLSKAFGAKSVRKAQKSLQTGQLSL